MVNSLGLGIGGAVLGAVGIGLIAFGAYKRLGSKDYNIIYILLAVAGIIFLGVSIFMMIKGFGGGGKAKVLEENLMSGAYGRYPTGPPSGLPGGMSPYGSPTGLPGPGGMSPYGSPTGFPGGVSPGGSPLSYQTPGYFPSAQSPYGAPGGYAPYGFPIPQ